MLGVDIDTNLEDEVRVTVIATGFDSSYQVRNEEVNAGKDVRNKINNRNTAKENVLVGKPLIETKQFDIAIPLLEKLSHKRLKGSAVNVVHKINLCLSYFETAQYDKAITIYNENQRLFQQYKHNKIYGGNIAMLEVIASIINEQYDQAEELLNYAKKIYDDPRLQKSFQEFFDILNKAKVE